MVSFRHIHVAVWAYLTQSGKVSQSLDLELKDT